MAAVPPARHLLRARDLADRCYAESIGVRELAASAGLSFTTSFKRHFQKTPTEYRASYPPASAQVIIPACYVSLYGRPQHSTKGEDRATAVD
jgi:hypothetical protein